MGFEVVMTFFYLERKIFPQIVRAIRPGGLLIYKTPTSAQAKLDGGSRGPKNPAYLLEPGELLQLATGCAYCTTANRRGIWPRRSWWRLHSARHSRAAPRHESYVMVNRDRAGQTGRKHIKWKCGVEKNQTAFVLHLRSQTFVRAQ